MRSSCELEWCRVQRAPSRTATDIDENNVFREVENIPDRKRTLFIKINTRKGTVVNYNSSLLHSRSW